MSYPFAPKMIPAFLGIDNINELYEDQYEHIVLPVLDHVKKAFKTNVFDPRCQIIIAPPGSGKTTVWLVDLIWRSVAEAVKNGIKHNTIVLTSPDETINQANLAELQKIFGTETEPPNHKVLDKLEDAYGIDFRGLYSDPKDARGRGLEIIV